RKARAAVLPESKVKATEILVVDKDGNLLRLPISPLHLAAQGLHRPTATFLEDKNFASYSFTFLKLNFMIYYFLFFFISHEIFV
ncbi:hypothetical protein ACQ1P8_10560, partial [Ornithobacterium rhinotracheale]